jgi:hypothetical protein
VQLFVQGSPQLNMPDNIAYQASRGTWILDEDGSTGDFIDGSRNNDIWDCLGGGADDDTLSDGCIRIASLGVHGPSLAKPGRARRARLTERPQDLRAGGPRPRRGGLHGVDVLVV